MCDIVTDCGFLFLFCINGFPYFPTSVSSCDGWIVTGSAFGAYEDHAFIPPLEDFIRANYKADVPMAGICFGHQIMAQALGGKVEKFSGGWGVGYTNYEMPDQLPSSFILILSSTISLFLLFVFLTF